MKQPYFIVVLAHSLHGRLRRVHIPYQVLYGVLALALVGGFSLAGFLSSYLRMAWKVSNYNSLRGEFESLRDRYQKLQREADEKKQQLATLQLFASEVSVAYGIKRKLEGPADVSGEGRLLPTMRESLEEYSFLRSADLSKFYRSTPRLRLAGSRPSLWPVEGLLLSRFGNRTDPFRGEGAFHTGVDISAPVGNLVRVAADGVVIHAAWSGAYGKLVVVDHGQGLETYYAHLSRFDVLPGQEIRRGETVGASGATGRVTSPHVHYEVRVHGTPVNPYQYLVRSGYVETAARRDFPF